MDDDDDIGDVAFGKERKMKFLVSKKKKKSVLYILRKGHSNISARERYHWV